MTSQFLLKLGFLYQYNAFYIFEISFNHPDSGLQEKYKISILTILCRTSKGFTKVLKALKKPFHIPQRCVKITISVNFYFEVFL